MSRRLAAAVALAAWCSCTFPDVGYRVDGGAGGTSGTTATGSSSSTTASSTDTCTVPKVCTDAAVDCAGEAKKAHATCNSHCGASQPCRDSCDTKQVEAFQACADACVICAADACDAGALACDRVAGL